MGDRKLPRTSVMPASPILAAPCRLSNVRINSVRSTYGPLHTLLHTSAGFLAPSTCQTPSPASRPPPPVAHQLRFRTYPDRPTASPSLSCVIASILPHRRRIRHSATSNSYISSSPVSLNDVPSERTRLCWTRRTSAARMVCCGRAERRTREKTARRPRLSRVEATRFG